MAYEYVTDNNLYEKQNYMYSEYRGMDFLRDYLDSRHKAVDGVKAVEKVSWNENLAEDPVQRELMLLLQKLELQECSQEVVDKMNAYTKSFEVRKRIYSGYDSRWKPMEGVGFENYLSYLLFADCLLHMYKYTACLKYFNCLLKVDDTLLSVRSHLSESLMEYLGRIIKREMVISYQLIHENGINLEVAE